MKIRRWHLFIVDDQEKGSLEIWWKFPMLYWNNNVHDDYKISNVLDEYLPEPYMHSEEENFQIGDHRERILREAQRRPIIDCERSLVTAWKLIETFDTNPPDLILLDVRLDNSGDSIEELQEILKEIGKAAILSRKSESITFSEGEVEKFQLRGGIYLFGKLLRMFPNRNDMPLTVLYSESSEVHDEYQPIHYALDGRFEILEKYNIVNVEADHIRIPYIEKLILNSLRGGKMDLQVIWDTLSVCEEFLGKCELLSDGIQEEEEEVSLRGEIEELLKRVMGQDIGDGWVFGTFFILQTPKIVAGDLDDKRAAVDKVRSYLHMVDYVQLLCHFCEESPLTLYAHPGTEYTFDAKPLWFPTGANWRSAFLHNLVSHAEELQDKLVQYWRTKIHPGIRNEMKSAIDSLHNGFPKDIDHLLNSVPKDSTTLKLSIQNNAKILTQLQDLRDFFRVKDCPTVFLSFLKKETSSAGLELIPDDDCEYIEKEECLSKAKALVRKDGLRLLIQTYFLPQKDSSVGKPLTSLFIAIIKSMKKYAYENQEGKCYWSIKVNQEKQRVLISLRDVGLGFSFERLANFMKGTGDLASAIREAKGWVNIKIHSGCMVRNPHVDGDLGFETVEEDLKGSLFLVSFYARVRD